MTTEQVASSPVETYRGVARFIADTPERVEQCAAEAHRAAIELLSKFGVVQPVPASDQVERSHIWLGASGEQFRLSQRGQIDDQQLGMFDSVQLEYAYPGEDQAVTLELTSDNLHHPPSDAVYRLGPQRAMQLDNLRAEFERRRVNYRRQWIVQQLDALAEVSGESWDDVTELGSSVGEVRIKRVVPTPAEEPFEPFYTVSVTRPDKRSGVANTISYIITPHEFTIINPDGHVFENLGSSVEEHEITLAGVLGGAIANVCDGQRSPLLRLPLAISLLRSTHGAVPADQGYATVRPFTDRNGNEFTAHTETIDGVDAIIVRRYDGHTITYRPAKRQKGKGWRSAPHEVSLAISALVHGALGDVRNLPTEYRSETLFIEAMGFIDYLSRGIEPTLAGPGYDRHLAHRRFEVTDEQDDATYVVTLPGRVIDGAFHAFAGAQVTLTDYDIVLTLGPSGLSAHDDEELPRPEDDIFNSLYRALLAETTRRRYQQEDYEDE